jgi:hypothetical protein
VIPTPGAKTYLAEFITTYAQRLKTLEDLSLYDYMSNIRADEPDRFTPDPIRQMPRLDT